MKAVNLRQDTFDQERDNRPFYYYKRVPMLQPTEYVLFQLEWGWNFVLREIREIHQEYYTVRELDIVAPDIFIQALQTGSTIQYHNVPAPVAQMVTPGPRAAYWVTELAPFAPGVAKGFGINFTAGPAKIAKIDWGYVWPYRDAVQLQLTGQIINDPTDAQANWPSYVDLMLVGRYYHQDDLGVWKGGNQ